MNQLAPSEGFFFFGGVFCELVGVPTSFETEILLEKWIFLC